MDIQTGLMIAGGVAVVVAIVILLISLFGSSGTTYEEAIAEQKKAAGELLALAGNKTKANTKKNKKLGRKVKEKRAKEAVQQTASEGDSDVAPESEEEQLTRRPSKGHVEFAAQETIVQESDHKPVMIRKRGKEPKVKPILLNKEDPSCMSDISSPPSPTESVLTNHFEEIHPKDEFELMHVDKPVEKCLSPVVEKKEQAVNKNQKSSKKNNKSKDAQLKNEIPAPQPVAIQTVAAAAPVKEPPQSIGDGVKEQRKGKKRNQIDEGGDNDLKQDQLVVQEPTVERVQNKQVKSETQSSQTTPAATPQQGKGKKNKKVEQNPLAVIGGSEGINVNELIRIVTEAPMSRSEIQLLTDTLLNKQHGPLPEHSEWTEGPNDPVQKLKRQLADKEKALTDEQEASQALHAKLKELRNQVNSERAACKTHRTTAEEVTARLQRVLHDNSTLHAQIELLQNKLAAENEIQAQRVQMEMHIQRLTESEAVLMQQNAALQSEITGRVVEAGQAREQAMMAQQHNEELAHQLQEANRAYSEMEALRQSLLLAKQASFEENRQANDRIASLQAELQRITRTRDDEASRATQLNELVETLKKERDELTTRLNERPQQNGITHEKNEKMESAVESLRVELANALKAVAEHRTQLAEAQRDLNTYREKNNELRCKNWKVMEALKTTEKALEAKTTTLTPSLHEAVKTACEQQYKEIKEILLKNCPQIKAPSAKTDKEWISAFATNMKSTLSEEIRSEKQIVNNSSSNDRVTQLEENNVQLQSMVDKYKGVIHDTESILSRLQSHISSEEERWMKQLDDKQKEVDTLRSQLSQMQKKIDTLHSELTRQGKHNHNNLADAERFNEEHMRHLDKNDVGSLNGPSQVGQ